MPEQARTMLPSTASVDAALLWAKAQGIERLDAQLLLATICGPEGAGRAWVAAHGTDVMTAAQRLAFLRLAERRLDHEPMAYILGWREFHGLRLQIDTRVLDPRPDTETLVDWALDMPLGQGATILDLGTGSGAVALALKAARPQWAVRASDVSTNALEVARRNAMELGLQVDFRPGSWLDAHDAGSPADLIVSNPPYIESADPHLPALKHEPALALTSGPDGLNAIRAIARQAPGYLRPGGWLLLEHGHDQAGRVREILLAAGFAGVVTRRDLAGIERCSGGQIATLG